MLEANNVCVSILVEHLERGDMCGVPVVAHFTNKVEILVSEEEFVLPILLVFKENLLLNRMLWVTQLWSFGNSRLTLFIHH